MTEYPMVVGEDGTAYLDMLGEKEEMIYDESAFYTANDTEKSVPSPYTFADGTLTMNAYDGSILSFCKLNDEELAYYNEHGSEVDYDALADLIYNSEHANDEEYHGMPGFYKMVSRFENGVEDEEVSRLVDYGIYNYFYISEDGTRGNNKCSRNDSAGYI